MKGADLGVLFLALVLFIYFDAKLHTLEMRLSHLQLVLRQSARKPEPFFPTQKPSAKPQVPEPYRGASLATI
jgi:hypothetical protein